MVRVLMKFFAVAPLLLLALFLAGCDRPAETGKLQVVASIAPLTYFAERIGGSHVSVSVMVPPGGNPHSYEPSPRQMVRLGEATLFIKAGSGVEFELDWMERFLSLNRRLRICNAVEGVRLLPIKHDEEPGAHHHDRYDPHYWLSPANGVIIAKNVERALVLADPANRVDYAVNSAKLIAELQVLDREIMRKVAGLKSRRFLVFHPAWGYYADAYRFEQIAVEEEGKTLTPRQMQRVIEKARANHIRVVFVSPQFSSSQAKTIAAEIGGVTRSVDPLAADYQENLRRATQAFSESMP
jgi:zinc transport system substrate-binding protein